MARTLKNSHKIKLSWRCYKWSTYKRSTIQKVYAYIRSTPTIGLLYKNYVNDNCMKLGESDYDYNDDNFMITIKKTLLTYYQN